MNNEAMEEELTLKQADELGDDFITYVDSDALQHAMFKIMTEDGQLYTQVDGEDDPIYIKGLHIINRTGVYAVHAIRIQKEMT